MKQVLPWSLLGFAISVIKPMRWIGIDPGLRTTGFGIIDVDGQQLRYVASGTIQSGDPSKGLP